MEDFVYRGGCMALQGAGMRHLTIYASKYQFHDNWQLLCEQTRN